MSAWTQTSRVLVFGSIVLCLAVIRVGTTAAQEWDLSGEWVIDLDESDDPAEAFDAVSQARRGQSGVGVGVGIFGVPVEVGQSGGRGSEPTEVVRRDLRRLRRHLVNAVDRLDVEQSFDNVRVRYSNVGTADYRPDAVLEDGEETLHAEWRRDIFTVVRDVGEDLKATEQLYLDRSDPNRLHWRVSIELSSVRARTVRINRVYDRVPQP
jgi:hypothetical protein